MNDIAVKTFYDRFANVYARQESYLIFSRRLTPFILSTLMNRGSYPKTALDLACGVGVAAEIFAKAGLSVTGVDQSRSMLNQAKKRAHAGGFNLNLIEQDIQNLSLDPGFDLITCMYDSLNYIVNEASFFRTLATAAELLNPGGWFVFDMATPFALSKKWVGVNILKNNADVFEIHQAAYDSVSRLNTKVVSFFIREDHLFRRFDEVHVEKAYALDKIEEFLKKTELDIVEKYADHRRAQVTDESVRVIYFIRKP